MSAWNRRVATCLVALALSTSFSVAAGETHHVLVLNSYHQGYVWSDNIMEGIRDTLDKSHVNVEIFAEYMDTRRHEPEKLFTHLAALYAWKYREPLDLVVVADNNALEFALRYRERLLYGAPIVFCGINNYRDSLIDGHEGVTGVVEDVDTQRTVELILEMDPNLRELVVIADSTPTSRQILEEFKRQQNRASFKIKTLIDWNWSELGSELAKLKPGAATMSLAPNRDRESVFLSGEEAMRWIVSHSNVPDYSPLEWSIDAGSLGGVPTSARSHGSRVAEIALRVLAGESPDSIPVIRSVPEAPMFNYDQMVRFGIARSRLPPGSVVLHEPSSMYARHKREVLAGAALLVAQSIIIALLWVSVVRRKRAESDLRQRNKRFSYLADRAHIIPWDWEADTSRFLDVGSQAEAIFGYPIEDWYRDRFWTDHLHKDDKERAIEECDAAMRTDGDFAFEYRMIAADGRIVWIRDIVSILASVKPRVFQGYMIDITEQRQAEDDANQQRERLSHVARVASMGEMASGIAHEINQPLTAIATYAVAGRNLVKAGTPDVMELSAILKKIHAGAHRAADVIRKLRGLVKKRPSEPVQAEINHIVREVVGLAEMTTRLHDAKIECVLADSLPGVFVDAVQMQQVFLNLVHNAIEAMVASGQKGPRVTVTTSFCDDCVRISIADRGPGVAKEQAARLFEPFYTTKPSGMGLGLAISRSIIVAHGGQCWHEPNSHGGATFVVTLPAVDENVMPHV